MQPERNTPEENWQPPQAQSSQSPYAVPPQEQPASQPVVTMAPEAAPQAQPLPAEPQGQPSSANVDAALAATAAPDASGQVPASEEPVHWQAHEYIHREKNAGWFVVFAIVVLALMAAAVFLMQSISFAILIPVMAAALIVYVRRPPRVLDYTLSGKGLYINDQLYPFSDFKGFGVIHDGEEYSVMLIPVKRFHPGVSVYFPEESGEAIVDMLGVRLPMQDLHLDVVDRILRKLRI